MMHDLEEFLKDLFLITWVLYLTVMSIIQLFEVESFTEAFMIFIMWGWITAFSCSARYW